MLLRDLVRPPPPFLGGSPKITYDDNMTCVQVLEQERHQLRLRLEEAEEEQQQRLLELAADAAALR